MRLVIKGLVSLVFGVFGSMNMYRLLPFHGIPYTMKVLMQIQFFTEASAWYRTSASFLILLFGKLAWVLHWLHYSSAIEGV